MISRRELFIGATALAVPAARRVSLTLGVGNVAVHLDDVDVDVLTGVPARFLSLVAPSSPSLTIEVSRGRGWLRWRGERACGVVFPAGVTGFVAAWALPLVTPGVIGFSGEDLAVLLRQGRARYWPSTPWRELPSVAACHVCFLGAWDLATISQHAAQVERHLAPSADFILPTAALPSSPVRRRPSLVDLGCQRCPSGFGSVLNRGR